MDLRFWTSCNEIFTEVGLGLGYRWSRAEVLFCGIASKFHHITPIPICLRCQDDHQSVAAIKLSRKQMVYSRARILYSSLNLLYTVPISQKVTETDEVWPRKGQIYVLL